jgi:hypothetical protein
MEDEIGTTARREKSYKWLSCQLITRMLDQSTIRFYGYFNNVKKMDSRK